MMVALAATLLSACDRAVPAPGPGPAKEPGSGSASPAATSAQPTPTPVGRKPTEGVRMFITDTGLQYGDIVEGTGASPKRGDTCVIHYTGWLPDGKIFDSSVDKGRPFEIQYLVTGLIQGWNEGLATMKVGGRRKLVVPPALGYGARGYPPTIPPDATLIFELELLGIK
jgi:peptidylprolyl isomerase